jgi:hypothetical protein
MRYRVVCGMHIQSGPDGRDMIYHTGDVFETDADMLEQNGAGMTPKFELVEDGANTSQPPGGGRWAGDERPWHQRSDKGHTPEEMEEAARAGPLNATSHQMTKLPSGPTSTADYERAKEAQRRHADHDQKIESEAADRVKKDLSKKQTEGNKEAAKQASFGGVHRDESGGIAEAQEPPQSRAAHENAAEAETPTHAPEFPKTELKAEPKAELSQTKPEGAHPKAEVPVAAEVPQSHAHSPQVKPESKTVRGSGPKKP